MRFPCAMALAACCALMARADPVPGHVEGWTVSASGWIDRDPGEMFVTHDASGNPGGSLAGDFLPSISPEADAFRAETSASGGAFTGNYRAQFALIAGWRFDYLARDILPSSVTVRFGNPGTNFFQSVTAQIAATGVWQSVFVSLESSAGWSGPLADFSNTLLNVEYVEVQVVRSGAASQRYQLDNFELVRLAPRAAGVAAAGGGAPTAIVWRDLKPGATYGVESAPAVTGTWAAAGSLLATNAQTAWPVPASNTNRLFHRLVLDNPAL